MNFIKGVYIVAMGGLLIMFVAFAIGAFYEAPEPPREAQAPGKIYPAPRSPVSDEDYYKSPEYQDWMEETNKLQEAYRSATTVYHRNVFLIAYPSGLLFIILSLLLWSRLGVISSGLLLGGLGTMIYATSQSFGDMDNKLKFAAIAIGLAVLIYLGYKKLVQGRAADEV